MHTPVGPLMLATAVVRFLASTADHHRCGQVLRHSTNSAAQLATEVRVGHVGVAALLGGRWRVVHRGLDKKCLLAGRAMRVGVTCDELDRIVHKVTVERGAYPSPLNYYKFPKSVCTSVNEVICHCNVQIVILL